MKKGDIIRNKNPYKGEVRYKIVKIVKGWVYAVWEKSGYMSGFDDTVDGFTTSIQPNAVASYELV